MKLKNLIKSKHNCRREYLPELIEDLAQSIKEVGLLSKLIIRESAEGGVWEVLGGWRRKLALEFLYGEDYELLPENFLIREVSDKDAFRLSLVENVQRVNFSTLDLAGAVRLLKEEDASIKNKEIAKLLWTSEARVKRLAGIEQEHLEVISREAVEALSMADENDPPFTDLHMDVMRKKGAFDLSHEHILEICDTIIGNEVPASRAANVIERYIKLEEPDDVGVPDPEANENKDDPAMIDKYKGTVQYNEEGDMFVVSSKESRKVDLGYYHPFVQEKEKFMVLIDAKVTIKTLE